MHALGGGSARESDKQQNIDLTRNLAKVKES
jgi:hypothetical protein